MASITIASTSLVGTERRGKLSGLVMTCESFGRFLGPAGFSNLYAWSISHYASSLPLVNYQFVFFIPAICFAAALPLGWKTLSAENLKITSVRG